MEEASSLLSTLESIKPFYDEKEDIFLKEIYFFHQFLNLFKNAYIDTEMFDLAAPFFGLFNDIFVEYSIEFLFEDEILEDEISSLFF